MRNVRTLVRLAYTQALSLVRNIAGWITAEDELVRENQEFWNDTEHSRFRSRAHWRGSRVFQDDELWLRLGESHRTLLNRALAQAEIDHIHTVIEWGCGGGMNAVQLAKDVETYHGVDICRSTLEECHRQVAGQGLDNFHPILIDAAEPESVCHSVPELVDVFLCTYVFELMPTRSYGLRIVKLASRLLRPGGVALLHIRYSNNLLQQSRPWDYASNLAHNTTFSLKEFREAVHEVGFDVLFEHVVPEQKDLDERRYAFFALCRPRKT